LLDLGIYPVALNRLILGRGPHTVRALAGTAQTGVEDQVEAIFQTASVMTSLGCSFLGQLSHAAFIAGDQGAIQIPRFWSTTQAALLQGGDVVEHFEDGREGHGSEFEIAAATQDILAGRTVSSVVPLSASLGFQEDMDAIRNAAGLHPPGVK
jgi:predicted dehydrogenase